MKTVGVILVFAALFVLFAEAWPLLLAIVAFFFIGDIIAFIVTQFTGRNRHVD